MTLATRRSGRRRRCPHHRPAGGPERALGPRPGADSPSTSRAWPRTRRSGRWWSPGRAGTSAPEATSRRWGAGTRPPWRSGSPRWSGWRRSPSPSRNRSSRRCTGTPPEPARASPVSPTWWSPGTARSSPCRSSISGSFRTGGSPTPSRGGSAGPRRAGSRSRGSGWMRTKRIGSESPTCEPPDGEVMAVALERARYPSPLSALGGLCRPQGDDGGPRGAFGAALQAEARTPDRALTGPGAPRGGRRLPGEAPARLRAGGVRLSAAGSGRKPPPRTRTIGPGTAMNPDHPPSAGWRPHPRYPDPAIETLDPRFDRYRIFSAAVERLHTGCRWSEGPVLVRRRTLPAVERHSERSGPPSGRRRPGPSACIARPSDCRQREHARSAGPARDLRARGGGGLPAPSTTAGSRACSRTGWRGGASIRPTTWW